jgi:MinD superfamily P-loop ATPase
MATETESEWDVKVPDKPLKDKVYFENLKSVVIDTEMCSRCLTCAAVCPGGITVVNNKVDFPDYETKCFDCGACVRVPGGQSGSQDRTGRW